MPLAIAAIACLSVVNYFGVKPGSRVLNVLVVLKVGALAIIIVAGALAPSSAGWWSEARASSASASTLLAFGAALVPILFAYGGWQNANYIAEEIDNPRRNLPLSLLVGTLTVVLIYVTVNVVYLRALGLEGLAATTTPASKAAAFMFGALGDRFVTAAIAISTFGFLDLAILAPTRVYYAMAADRVFLPALSRLHPTVPDAVDRDHHPVDVVVRAGADRTLRAAAQLRRVRRLDLLRPDRRDGRGVPADASAVAASARHVPRAGLSGRPDRFRRGRGRRRAERGPSRPGECLARSAAARGWHSGVLLVYAAG